MISGVFDCKIAFFDRYSLFLPVPAIYSNFRVNTADNIYTDAIMTGRMARFFVFEEEIQFFPFRFNVLARSSPLQASCVNKPTDYQHLSRI